MIMQIDSMRYFIELSEAGSFYSAAKRTHMSQQGLNKSISSLESELGVKLIERSPRGIRLTSRGERFLIHARLITKAFDKMLDDVYAIDSPALFGEARATVYATYYPVQISGFLFGQRRLVERTNLIETPFKQLIEKVVGSDGSELFLVDLYPKALARLTSRPELAFEPILCSRLGVVWSEGSPFDGTAAVHREQLSGVPLAANLQRDMAKLLDDVFEGFPSLKIAYGAANPRMTLEYARASRDMVATFDSFGFSATQKSQSPMVEGLSFAPFSTPKSQCFVGFLYPKAAKPSPKGRRIIEAVRENLLEGYPDYFKEYPVG